MVQKLRFKYEPKSQGPIHAQDGSHPKNQLFLCFSSKFGGSYSLRIRLMSEPKGKPAEDGMDKTAPQTERKTKKETG